MKCVYLFHSDVCTVSVATVCVHGRHVPIDVITARDKRWPGGWPGQGMYKHGLAFPVRGSLQCSWFSSCPKLQHPLKASELLRWWVFCFLSLLLLHRPEPLNFFFFYYSDKFWSFTDRVLQPSLVFNSCNFTSVFISVFLSCVLQCLFWKSNVRHVNLVKVIKYEVFTNKKYLIQVFNTCQCEVFQIWQTSNFKERWDTYVRIKSQTRVSLKIFTS